MVKTFQVNDADLVSLQGHTEVKALFPDENTDVSTMAAVAGPSLNYLSYAMIKKGSKGADVRFAQKQLKLYIPSEAAYVIVDGDFGTTTETAIKAFQTKCGISSDGIVGGGTWPRLGPEVGSNMQNYWNKTLSIKEVQRLLKLSGRYTGSIDGIFGTGTLNGIKNFQQSYGLTKDGIWGKQCWGIIEQGWI